MPLEAIGPRAAQDKLVKELIHVVPAGMHSKEPPKRVPLYSTQRLSDGYLGVPRAYAERLWADQWPIVYLTVQGVPMSGLAGYTRPDHNHPSVREPVKQRQFMDDLAAGIRDLKTFLATAPTGTGKTVSSLDAALVRGRATFIMVHLDRLMRQWKKTLMDILKVPEDKIAMISGDNKDGWQDADFAIGIYNTMVLTEFPPEFYSRWGTVIFDEVHKVGSKFFAPVAPKFPADVKLGLSATMGRKDRGDKVFIFHLGPIRVKSTAEYLPMDVHVLRHKATTPLWGNDLATRLKCLAADPVRNRKHARLIAKAYERNRQALVVSTSIEHLQELMRITHEEFSVPYRVMGRFFGEVHLGERKERDRFGNPVKKKLRKKRTPKELEAVLENAQITFATYGMVTEGIDCPRWDWGLDALPQGKATQITGRVRRPYDGKDKAIWITTVDEECAFSQKMFLGRCKDYRATGATIIDSGA